jgi:hypothetical protein
LAGTTCNRDGNKHSVRGLCKEARAHGGEM